MSVTFDASAQLTGTPGALDKPGPSQTPSTELFTEVFGGRAASINISELPTVRFEGEHFDSQPSETEAQPSDPIAIESTAAAAPCPPRQGLQPHEHQASDSLPEGACSLQALIERLERMIFGDGERPRASGLEKAESKATAAFVVAVRAAAGKLWLDREDDVKRALAPLQVDEVDCIAYLVADALGRPLLHPDDRNALGKRVLTQATRAEAAIKSAEKTAADAVRRAKAAAEADASKLPRVAAAEAKGAEAIAAACAKPTPDLQLPARTVGKRRREPELMPPPPLPAPTASTPKAAEPAAEGLEVAMAAAVAAEVQRQLAAHEAACRAAHAAEQERADAARALAVRERVSAARAARASAEKALKDAKRERARLGPTPALDLPAYPGPPRDSEYCGQGQDAIQRRRAHWDEHCRTVDRPYTEEWMRQCQLRSDAVWNEGIAQGELECCEAVLRHAESELAVISRRVPAEGPGHV